MCSSPSADGPFEPAPRRIPPELMPRSRCPLDAILHTERIDSDQVFMPLSLTSCLLSTAFFVVAPYIVEADAMHSKYAFVPVDLDRWTGWVIAAFGIGLVQLLWVPLALYVSYLDRCGRWMLCVAIAMYLSLLLVGNVQSASETTLREANEQVFAAAFNNYYCTTRTMRACLGDAQEGRLVLMRGHSTALAPSENVTEVAYTTWGRCRSVLSQSISRDFDFSTNSYGSDLSIQVQVSYKFLNACNGSHEVDAWCGHYFLRLCNLTDQEQRAVPSPYALNPSMSPEFTGEWATRMLYADVLGGGAAGGMILAAISILVRVATEVKRRGW